MIQLYAIEYNMRQTFDISMYVHTTIWKLSSNFAYDFHIRFEPIYNDGTVQ